MSSYDEISFEEHKRLEFHDEYRQRKARYIKQYFPNGEKFLDVGCGSGFDLKHQVQELGGGNCRCGFKYKLT